MFYFAYKEFSNSLSQQKLSNLYQILLKLYFNNILVL